jgi:hypothetical protein
VGATVEVLSQSVQQPQQLAKHQRARNPLNQMAAALTTPGTVKAVVRVLKANMQLSTMKLRVRNTSLASNKVCWTHRLCFSFLNTKWLLFTIIKFQITINDPWIPSPTKAFLF